MFAQVNCPETLPLHELDAYLEKGWFRMGQTIFTTNFLRFKDQFYSAIWLRIDLKKIDADTAHQKLLRRNAIFRTEIKEASIDPVKETLFSRYRQNLSFEASASLQSLMFGKAGRSIYSTQEINIYDGDKLIATGFFDLGVTSAAGIICFYDPAYKKYSLGKYLILLKIAYCRKANIHYFYPGYFVPGYIFFDYKLEIQKHSLQYLQLRSRQWLPIDSFMSGHAPLEVMRDSLEELQQKLARRDIHSQLLMYEFFDANLIPSLQGAELFDFPLFLSYGDDVTPRGLPLVVYDVRDSEFHLMVCRSVWESNTMTNTPGMYSTNLLKVDQLYFSSAMVDDIVSFFVEKVKP